MCQILSSTYVTLCSKTTHTTKHLHCYKIYKCNNYEYNKHTLISMSGYKFTAQHCTIVNINAWTKKKITVQYKQQNSRNMLTNRQIHNNALVVQVIQKSWAIYMQLSSAVRLCTKIGLFQQVFFSLNGHDSSYIMSAKKAVLQVPTLGHKSTNMQSTDFHNTAGQQYSSGFLVWRLHDMPL